MREVITYSLCFDSDCIFHDNEAFLPQALRTLKHSPEQTRLSQCHLPGPRLPHCPSILFARSFSCLTFAFLYPTTLSSVGFPG